MHFDLRRIDSGELPWLRPTLEVDAERVAMVRRVPMLPPLRRNEFPRSRLVSAMVRTKEKIDGIRGLNLVAQQSVVNEATGPDDRFLLLAFDGDIGQETWVLKGSDHEMERAERSMIMPTTQLVAATEVEATGPRQRSQTPVEDPDAESLMRALVGAGVVCTLLGTALFLFSGRGDNDSLVRLNQAAQQPEAVQPEPQDGQAQPPPGSPEPPDTAISATPIEVPSAAGSPLGAGRLSAAAANLTRHLGRRPRVYRIIAGERSATFEVYRAGRSDVVERWELKSGKLVGPEPGATPPLDGGEFLFNDVRLGRVPNVVAQAKRLINAGSPVKENASVVIRRNVPTSRELRIRVDITGPRSQDVPPVFATPGGKIVGTP